MAGRVVYKMVAEVSVNALDVQLDFYECLGDSLYKIPNEFLSDRGTVQDSAKLDLRSLLMARADLYERAIQNCINAVKRVVELERHRVEW